MNPAAPLLGLAIGAALGLLGGGGSILTVPIFVYVLGYPAKDAIAMSLAVVGVTSLVGVLGHWRSGNVRGRTAVVFGGVAMGGTLAGARAAALLTGTTQLVLFGCVMLGAATVMFRGARRASMAAASAPAKHGGAALVAAALGVGALTGLVGVGGGFLIVPALVMLGLPMRAAVGTSLLVIAGNCAVGLYGYLGQVHLAWADAALVTAGTVPGILAGTYANQFVPQATLRQAFAVFLVLVGAFILYQNSGAILAPPSAR